MALLRIYLSRDNPIDFDLGEEKATLGRLAHNTLQIDEASVSGHHADIFLKSGRYHLHDAGSTNGTFVNGQRITHAVLRDRDEIRFGTVEGLFLGEQGSVLSEPRPDFLATSLEVASSSTRPANFVSTSPSPKRVKANDALARALFGLAALAFLSAGAALLFVLAM